MKNSIRLYSISELLERDFFIPSYQRGYRWTKQQVDDLLNDIYSFAIKKKKKDKEFYCLQPVVVKPHKWLRRSEDGSIKEIDGWELVDGQQRLTTLKILFSFLIKEHLKGESLKAEYGKDVFRLDYETREDTERFLNSITEYNNGNIDYFYISSAYQFIRKWFEKQEVQRDARDSILRTLVYDLEKQKSEGVVQVIWYQIEEGKNPIDTFIRINSGKISLTNSELIKALFLQDRNFGDDKKELAKLRQLEIANEWDRIENALQDEDFWWFLNSSQNKIPARIEFIFDLMRKVAIKREPELVEQIGTDRYATFRYFYQRLDSNDNFDFIKTEWAKVTGYFHTFLEWFNNPVWYHYIGFLIYCDDSVVDLFDLTTTESVTKDDITKALRHKITSKFSKIKWNDEKEREPFLDLNYPKDSTLIRELLLLFNLQYIIAQCESHAIIFKFPFKSFKEEDWDVEHIDSYTENPLNNRETQIEWLNTAQIDLHEITENIKLVERINLFVNDERAKESFELIQTEIITLAGEEIIDKKTKNNIGNLTLLDAETNRSYGNALFPTKRRIIIEKDRSGTFIPICTKNVFLKYFDLKGSSRTQWMESDMSDYTRVITETLAEFLPPKPIINKSK